MAGLSRLQAFLGAAILLALLVFVTRYGQLYREVINPDESTFILMAQDVLRGHLPYEAAIDNKPPGIFFLLALVMQVFGQSVYVVRNAGSIFVFATALLVFVACLRLSSALTALASTALMIAAMASIRAGQHFTTEIVVILLISACIVLNFSFRDRFWAAVLTGVLLSIATIVRSNIAIVVVVLGCFYLVRLFSRTGSHHRLAVVGYVLGGLGPLLVLLAAYALKGQLTMLYLGSVKIALSYAGGELSLPEVVINTLRNISQEAKRSPACFGAFVALAAVGGAVMGRDLVRRGNPVWPDEQTRADLVFVIVFTAATLLSLLFSGQAYPHYLINLLPFAALAMAYGMDHAAFRPWRSLALAVAAFGIAVSIAQGAPRTIVMVMDRPAAEKGYALRQVAAMITADRQPGDRVWALDNQLILFYLDEEPLSPLSVFPSNLFRPSIFNPMVEAGIARPDEFLRLLEQEPRYIVARPDRDPYYLKGQTLEKYRAILSGRYEPWTTVDHVIVYKRRS